MITQEILKELLHYDPTTGIFTWKVKVWPGGIIGSIAGSIGWKGYWEVKLHSKKYKGHRLAWFYVYGIWPSNQIDHKDRIKLNNAIDNLRDVPQTINQQNRIEAQRNNLSTGFHGVSYDKESGKYRARIKTDGIRKHLGRYETAELAYAAYLSAKKMYHPSYMP
jgi:hypothetical protein